MDQNIKQLTFRTMPVFTDRSITASQVASLPSKKDKKKAERKEGTIRIIFVDSVSNSVVADVVMTPIAAEQLAAGITKSLEQLKAQLKDHTMPAQPVLETAPQQSYIG
ncbi:MAG: hypothetical protein HY369_02425 [Candidatus Aenigmarchaeota archaeon]|nr:hypothetical protein [Candidatus Aenigmarchaeota archaeon]